MGIVTGHLLYEGFKRGADITPNFQTNIGYLNQWLETTADKLSDSAIRILLRKVGVAEADIIEAKAGVDFDREIIEIFFAYKTAKNPPAERMDLWLSTSYHKYGSYAGHQAVLIPWFSVIKADWKTIVLDLVKRFKITSFMVRPVPIPELPDLILKQNLKEGTLADMRNIPNSYTYLQKFKDANFQIIWYQTKDGKQLSAHRPKTGWK